MTLYANDGSGHHNSTASTIRAVAEPHGGHITREQLHALGLNDNAIQHLIARGFLIRVYHGVYAVGHLPKQPLDRAWAALLAVGDRSALAHGAAGSYWGVFRDWRFPLEVVTPLRRRPRGIRVHHRVTLTRADIHIDRQTLVRVTSAARTALDLTPRMTDKRATRMVNDLRVRRKTSRPELRSVLARNPRHPGTQRMTLIVLGSQREPTRSELENAYMRIVKAFTLPIPEINGHVHGFRVDFSYRELNLIIEVDGYDAHSDPVRFQEDRRQDREILLATGINTIRFTYDDCIDTPAMVATAVRAAVAKARG
jgi:predicted transcriptional regulator of viral defense system